MQQFRPLPHFDSLEDTEPVGTSPVPMPGYPGQSQGVQVHPPFVTPPYPPFTTTDALPEMGRARFVNTGPQYAAPHPPRIVADGQSTTGRVRAVSPNPQFAAQRPPQWPVPGAAPEPLTGPQPLPRTPTTAQVPIVLLSGSVSSSQTGKQPVPASQPTLTAALQAALAKDPALTGSTSGRIVVIPGARKTAQSSKAPRRLNARLRQIIVLLTLLVVVVCTLTSLVPLSDSQGRGNLFSNISNWFESAQLDWNIQAHQNTNTFPTQLNGPGLPYMTIANSPYVAVAEQDAQAAGIPFVYFVRQIQQESGFNPNAVSVTNAQGIAQFEPATAAAEGVDPWDPNSALRGAARLMASYYHQYGNNYAKALAAYNAGGGAVQNATYSCHMYWLGCMPGQTQDYVYRIMGV